MRLMPKPSGTVATIKVLLLWMMSLGCAAEARAEDDVSLALENAKKLVTFQIDDVPLEAQPVLATSNPTRGAGYEGSTHLWLNHGRPAVAVSIFEWRGQVVHEGRCTGAIGETVR